MISQVTFDENPLGVEIYYKDEVIYSESVKGNNIINSSLLRGMNISSLLIGRPPLVMHAGARCLNTTSINTRYFISRRYALGRIQPPRSHCRAAGVA